jgi:hypothetical protein
MHTDPLPIGTYLLRLVKAEHRDSTVSGRWFIHFRFEAVDPPYAGQPVFTSIAVEMLVVGALRWADTVCEALDTTMDDLIRRPDLLEGREVLAYVSVYRLQDFREVNTIRRMTRPVIGPVDGGANVAPGGNDK